MGNAPSVIRNALGRDRSPVETVALTPTSLYKWPPKIGNYFASYFIMGGQKFDTPQPEAYLFGDNNDLNFLGNRPLPFPYPLTSQPNEPTRTLQSLVNIRKDTLRLVKCDSPSAGVAAKDAANSSAVAVDSHVAVAASSSTIDVLDESQNGGGLSSDSAASTPVSAQLYNLEFVFDSDAPCVITILYLAKEDVGNGVVMYQPRDPSMTSRGFPYKSGANQTFSQPEHCIQPCNFSDADWVYSSEKDEIPVVIHCAVDSKEAMPHVHITLAAIEKTSDGYSIKAIKQKQLVDGLTYILQEFYGIENKEPGGSQGADGDDLDDNTSECVICMSDVRDTLILPCRHLCLCNGCADSLRYQASSCPICRSPFHALLQIRAIRRKAAAAAASGSISAAAADTNATAGYTAARVVAATADDDVEENGSEVSQSGVPAGYEAVSLIEALNGAHRRASPPAAVASVASSEAAAPAKSAGRSLSAEASLRRSRGSRSKLPSIDNSTAARRNKNKTGVPSCISASTNRESTATVADDQQEQEDIVCTATFAAADDVEAGPAAGSEASGACITVAVQTDETRLATEDSKIETRGASASVTRSDSNVGLSVASTPERACSRDEDTDSGIPDDLTEDGRAAQADYPSAPPELRRAASAGGIARTVGSAVGRSAAQEDSQAPPPLAGSSD